MIRIHFLSDLWKWQRPRERNEGEEGMTFWISFFLICSPFVNGQEVEINQYARNLLLSLSADYKFLLSLNNHALR